jgi:IS30 family transposase
MKKSRLSIEEREKILYYLSQEKSCCEIALLLSRSHTTISREVRRNGREENIPHLEPKIAP